MSIALTVITLAAIVLFAVGYKRQRRNMMLVATLLLLGSTIGPDCATAFIQGFHQGMASALHS
ncbi:hypothetical protein [Gallaecimonas mangrovi]|uniref:hypothetical protein n=1 Tax=Gallaecimonas mangrovi TaxID=2291597 RepID=UPI000E207516|nr:hypothetical protein [Gallaecimonas mangrovi]